MSAAVLRRAAALMRERADKATPGRWVPFDMDAGGPADHAINGQAGCWWVWAEDRLPYYGGVLDPDPHAANCNGRPETCCRVVVGTAGITDGREPEKERADADHISSWDPAVALAVADWLEQFAETMEAARDFPGVSPDHLSGAAAALAVARAYLGEVAP